jgi:UDP-glucose 4-epimerase
VFAALKDGSPGETYLPKPPAARITDIASTLIGDRDIQIKYIGIRPGEKIHEVMVGEEEAFRTTDRGEYFVLLPLLPELRKNGNGMPRLETPYTSESDLLTEVQVERILRGKKLMIEDIADSMEEVLR